MDWGLLALQEGQANETPYVMQHLHGKLNIRSIIHSQCEIKILSLDKTHYDMDSGILLLASSKSLVLDLC